MNKKIVAIVCALTMALSVTACGSGSTDSDVLKNEAEETGVTEREASSVSENATGEEKDELVKDRHNPDYEGSYAYKALYQNEDTLGLSKECIITYCDYDIILGKTTFRDLYNAGIINYEDTEYSVEAGELYAFNSADYNAGNIQWEELGAVTFCSYECIDLYGDILDNVIDGFKLSSGAVYLNGKKIVINDAEATEVTLADFDPEYDGSTYVYVYNSDGDYMVSIGTLDGENVRSVSVYAHQYSTMFDGFGNFETVENQVTFFGTNIIGMTSDEIISTVEEEGFESPTGYSYYKDSSGAHSGKLEVVEESDGLKYVIVSDDPDDWVKINGYGLSEMTFTEIIEALGIDASYNICTNLLISNDDMAVFVNRKNINTDTVNWYKIYIVCPS